VDRRILIILAAAAGVTAAVLLFPDREATDADKAVGRERPEVTTTTTRTAQSSDGVSAEKASVNENLQALQNSAYAKHTQATTRYWMHLGNLLAFGGDTENGERARLVARHLRDGSRLDATTDVQQAALDEEGKILADLKALNLDGEKGDIVNYLEQASTALKNGEPPPVATFKITNSTGIGGSAEGSTPVPSTGPTTHVSKKKEPTEANPAP